MNVGRTVSDEGGIEEDGARNSSENVGEEVPHIHTFTQEAANEQGVHCPANSSTR